MVSALSFARRLTIRCADSPGRASSITSGWSTRNFRPQRRRSYARRGEAEAKSKVVLEVKLRDKVSKLLLKISKIICSTVKNKHFSFETGLARKNETASRSKDGCQTDTSTSDDVFELSGFKVLIEKKHAMYMAGVNIDFEDGINARGFVFNSPLVG